MSFIEATWTVRLMEDKGEIARLEQPKPDRIHRL